jgi:predicted transcriptional regulator
MTAARPTPPPLEKLPRREREILDALFALGDAASAEDIRERLVDPPSYSAVRAMLAKLEAKGYVRHREEGPRYVYSPTTSRTAARRAALRQLVRTFFAGSPGETVTALLKQEAWTDEELGALRAEIDRVRTERNRP